MKMDIVAGSQNDEFYTPPYAVRPVIPYLTDAGFTRVWCPFDTADSWFVKVLCASGIDVVYSHLATGQDFFSTEVPRGCQAVVSNPPYTSKQRVLQNLFSRKVPFAMLVGVVGLFESEARFTMFQSNTFEILYLNRRVSFFKCFSDQTPALNPPFSSVFLCSRVLPAQICFSKIDKRDVAPELPAPTGTAYTFELYEALYG